MRNSYLNELEIEALCFKKVGDNVKISRNASIYSPDKMTIGNNVRIDDFCVLSGEIILGNYIHIAAFCGLFGGGGGIEMKDFSGLSSRVSIYSGSDDYSGDFLTGPCIPLRFRKINESRVILEKHALVGTGSTILPGVTLNEGAVLGAMSLLTKNALAWRIHTGIPAKDFKDRKKELLNMEKELLNIYE